MICIKGIITQRHVRSGLAESQPSSPGESVHFILIVLPSLTLLDQERSSKKNHQIPHREEKKLVLASDLGSQVLLDNGTDVDVDGLVDTAQCCGKVAEVLSVVDNGGAQHLEWDDTGLAVWALLEGLDDADLVHHSGDGDNVVAGDKEEVVNVQSTDFLAVDVVDEGAVSLLVCE